MFQREILSYTNCLDKSVINSTFIEEIDYLHAMDIVKILKPKISSGFDEISSKLIKEMISNTIHPVTRIIDISLNTGIVPGELKLVIPVFKASDADQLKNY